MDFDLRVRVEGWKDNGNDIYYPLQGCLTSPAMSTTSFSTRRTRVRLRTALRNQ
ncbi:MAG TPA: hypothetical protein VE944_22665 [Nostoc sp.]|uniref:hypothetical protein n=1 Tax=Nostoc sp. TaxID=1180 RepID=UPI002D74F18E|nr:hypothetical protein [Nostoc sp.]HYX17099.1 hypothetical protein [Nostoc sp.]